MKCSIHSFNKGRCLCLNLVALVPERSSVRYRANEVSGGAASGYDGVRADESVGRLLVDQAHRNVQLLGHRLHHLRIDAL